MANSLETFNVQKFLSQSGLGRKIVPFRKGSDVFAQGEVCDTIFYLKEGSLKLTVLSQLGKEATIALLEPGSFCRRGMPVHGAKVSFVKCDRTHGLRSAKDHQGGNDPRAERRAGHVFPLCGLPADTRQSHPGRPGRSAFHSVEKRLARTLLLLANFGKEGVTETLVPEISQETLAAMIGCTRTRVNFFLNRFRKLGYIDYDDRIRVNKSLLQIILHD